MSSELDMSDFDIIDTYQGLWKIEESLKITKSILVVWSVYLSKKDHINFHFLICFTSLVILKSLEKELKIYDISINKAVYKIKKISATYINVNYYMLDRNNEIIKFLENIISLYFTKRLLSSQDIRHAKSFIKKDL